MYCLLLRFVLQISKIVVYGQYFKISDIAGISKSYILGLMMHKKYSNPCIWHVNGITAYMARNILRNFAAVNSKTSGIDLESLFPP